MEVVRHIDITGEERIRAILADPDNFVFAAYECEFMDGWAPDVGITNYANRSVFRPPSVARAGIPSTLRHRFWSTMEGKTDHTGWRCVGVVLYDAADEESPLEIRLGADDVGRLEPTRHDNRRHLLILDRKVFFEGKMEVFQVRAPGKGTYRIEDFVLLRELPAPSAFVPHIQHLSTAIVARGPETVRAGVHFVTAQAATCEITVSDKDGAGASLTVRVEELTTLFAVELPPLAPNRRYLVTVCATEKAGAAATATTELFTGEEAPQQSHVTVPVEVVNLAEQTAAGLPLTFGVPLAQGLVRGATACRVLTERSEQAAQVRIHSRWPDGSARWALVDVPCPAGLGPEARMPARVFFDDHSAERSRRSQPPSLIDGLTWQVTDTGVTVSGKTLQVAVTRQGASLPALIERREDAGGWRTVLGAPGSSSGFAFTLGNGVTLHSDAVEDLLLEEAGAERAVIRYRVPHRDSTGVAHLRSTVRVHVYAGQPFVKLTHRLEVISPALAPAIGGTRADIADAPAEIRSAIALGEGEEASLLTLQSVELRLGWTESAEVICAGRTQPVGDSWRLLHPHDLAHRVEDATASTTLDGRAPGHVLIQGRGGKLALGVRHFWQSYPKGIRVTQTGVAIELLPELAAEEQWPGDDDAWHRLYFWRDGARYRLKIGMAPTNDLLLAFPGEEDDVAAMFAWLEQPPVVRPDIAYLNGTHALSPVGPKRASRLPRYEAMVDHAHSEWLADREQYRQYGFVNFGDWYGEGWWCWGNNEYDVAFAHYTEFLRGGDPRWAELAAQAARHLADIDTCNASRNPAHIGGQYVHIAAHAGGFLPPFFRSKMAGSSQIPSHMWAEGPALHYLLTGDETQRESLERTGAWLTRGGMNHYDFTNMRESGWHLIHLTGMAKYSDDPRYLNAARIIVERMLERQEPMGGWEHLLTLAHCDCHPPRCRGEAGFMVGVTLAGLRRVHELTGDARVAAAIVGGARWLIAHTYVPAARHFRYTSCSSRGTGPGPGHTRQIIDGLAYAYRLSRDPLIGAIVAHGLDDLGWTPKIENSGYGKALCMETRYVPMLLADLEP